MMKTVFIRVLEASVEDKAGTILRVLRAPSPLRFAINPMDFKVLPGATFAYWAGATLLRAQRTHETFEPNHGVVRVGVQTDDDPRFVRCWWEVAPVSTASELSKEWPTFLKGMDTSSFYSSQNMRLRWKSDGEELKAATVDAPGGRINNETDYFKQGLSWALRTTRFEPHFVPRGCIPSVSRYLALIDDGELALGALWNSRVVDAVAKLRMERFGHPKFIVGVIKDLPMPRLSSEVNKQFDELAMKCWCLKHHLDTSSEASLAFLLPGVLQEPRTTLAERAKSWMQTASTAHAQLSALVSEIDAQAYRIFGISEDDRHRVSQGFGAGSDLTETKDDEPDGDQHEGQVIELDTKSMVASLLSWTLGVAFGRFDVRLATGERAGPREPGPFDPLPVCSPGMLTGEDGLPITAAPQDYSLTFPSDGILVDDPGHPRDVVRAVRSTFETVFDGASAHWHEAAELLGTPDLRTWFAYDFFEPQIRRYTKCRRKAPIYWQLATASGSYSVWLYIHRATGDTLFRVLNDFVGPKLDHERAKLDQLTQETSTNPSTSQRRELLEEKETFVGELQALKTEVARVAPLWKPNLDDGVLLNFAPLWRLVPQSRSWQGECKKAWDKLQAGEYDWAHLAMHLWPERVVPKCIDDRSLAIAHGLEDVFWHEDDSGTWRKSRVDHATVEKLIRERSSSTVKAALRELLSAPNPAASQGRKAKGRSPSPKSPSPKSSSAAMQAKSPEPAVDETTLRTIRSAIASVTDGASKADVLAATGLSDADWNKAIAALLDRGDVTRTGQKRGARYHASIEGRE